MPMYHLGNNQMMSQSMTYGTSAQVRSVEKPTQMVNFPRNGMRPSFSLPSEGYNGFGPPPSNLDFKIDGLPDDLQPKGLLNPLAFGTKKPVSIDEIIQNPDSAGLKVRVKKVIQVQQAEPEPELPPTPPLIKNQPYRSSQSRPINTRQEPSKFKKQDESDFEESPKYAISTRRRQSKVSDEFEESPRNYGRRKPNNHDPTNDNCDCHSCSPRKFCLCDDCQNSGHSLNCTCPDCRPDIYKKKIQSIFKAPSKPKQKPQPQWEDETEVEPNAALTYNRYNNKTPASVSDVSGPFIKQTNGYNFNKHLKANSDWSIPTEESFERASKLWYHHNGHN